MVIGGENARFADARRRERALRERGTNRTRTVTYGPTISGEVLAL
ncbi:hypothetical protein [Streptomyces sp. NPDC014734]